MKSLINETHIKQHCKKLLAIKHVFNYHLLQGVGSYKGVPDRILHYKNKVVYLEIKKPGGKMSPAQLIFKAQCEEDGVTYWCVSDIVELDKLLEEL